jgi:hypothetical protein
MIKFIAIHSFTVHGVGVRDWQLKIDRPNSRASSLNHFLENIQFMIHVQLLVMKAQYWSGLNEHTEFCAIVTRFAAGLSGVTTVSVFLPVGFSHARCSSRGSSIWMELAGGAYIALYGCVPNFSRVLFTTSDPLPGWTCPPRNKTFNSTTASHRVV